MKNLKSGESVWLYECISYGQNENITILFRLLLKVFMNILTTRLIRTIM